MKRKFQPLPGVDKKIYTLDDGCKPDDDAEYNTWWHEARKGIGYRQHLYSKLPIISQVVENDPKLEAKRLGSLVFNLIPNPGEQTCPLQGGRESSYKEAEGDEDIFDVIDKYGSLVSGGCKCSDFEIPADAEWKYPFSVEEYAWISSTRNFHPRIWCFKRYGAATLCLCSCGQWIVTPTLSWQFMVSCPKCRCDGIGSWKSMPMPCESQDFFPIERGEPCLKKRKIEPILTTPFGERSIFCFYAYIKMKTYFYQLNRSYFTAAKIFGHLSKFEGTCWFDIFLSPISEHVNVVDYLMLLFFVEDVEDMASRGQWSDFLDESTFWTGASLKYEIWKKKEKYLLKK